MKTWLIGAILLGSSVALANQAPPPPTKPAPPAEKQLNKPGSLLVGLGASAAIVAGGLWLARGRKNRQGD